MQKQYYYTKLWLYLFISILFIEGVFKVSTFGSIFDLAFFRVILFSLTVSIFLGFIYSIFNSKIAKNLVLITLLLFGFYALFQLGYHNLMGKYISFSVAGGAGDMTDFVGSYISSLKWYYFLTLLPFIVFLMMVFTKNTGLKKGTRPVISYVLSVLVILFLQIISILSLELSDKNQLLTNKKLYESPTMVAVSLRQFGVARFMWRDFVYFVNPKSNALEIDTEKEEEIITDFSRIIDDSKWEQLIELETNSEIKTLHEYYINQRITPRNTMTGYFKDKNLILIMVEAFDQIIFDEDLTPTLYKLRNEGWTFENFYAPEHEFTTGDTEFAAHTSIIPANKDNTQTVYSNNSYPFSSFNLFNEAGYYSSSYHNWRDEFYDRRSFHTSAGSSAYYNLDDIAFPLVGHWRSDYDLFTMTEEYYINKDKFFTFITTVSTHFPYDRFAGGAKMNWEYVKDLDAPTKIKYYMGQAMLLDQGLEYLINSLDEKGKLEDTVIVLMGDHHPLQMPEEYLNYNSSVDRLEYLNLYLRPFIIYNSEIEPKVYNELGSTFDILPTLANLFDLDYDPRYYMGNDLFSDEDKLVFLPSGSWITDKAMYLADTGEKIIYDDTIDDDYFIKINSKINDMISVSSKTLTLDYFKYLTSE